MDGEAPKPLDAAATVDLFVELSAALSAERSLPSLLGRILSAALRLTGARDGRIYGLDVTKQNLLPLSLDTWYWRAGIGRDVTGFGGMAGDLGGAKKIGGFGVEGDLGARDT